MFPAQVQDFCDCNIFLGKKCCVPTLALMKKIFRQIHDLNLIFQELNGTVFEANWYMAQNDRWINNNFELDPRFCAINPQVKSSYNEAVFVSEDDEGIFYPTVKL